MYHGWIDVLWFLCVYYVCMCLCAPHFNTVCDCVIVGGAADADLLKLAIATDGRVLQIRGLADAFEVDIN